jgi:hypothetical protein
MLLHDHKQVRYAKVRTYIGDAYSVTYRGKLAGHVMRRGTAWAYLLVGDNSDTQWMGGFFTRKDATDHLLSAFSPSAAWLV